MSSEHHWFRRPWIALAIFTILAGVDVFMSGEQCVQMANPQSGTHVPILTSGSQPESMELPGLPDDWSFHHAMAPAASGGACGIRQFVRAHV